MAIIKFDAKNTPIIQKTFVTKLVEFKKQIDAAEKEYTEMIDKLKAAMEENEVIKIDTPELLINYIPEGERESFDSKKFKEDNPDLYDEYITMKPIKSSIRVKVRWL